MIEYNYRSVYNENKWKPHKLELVQHNLPGKLICFEGVDGCGKTSLLNIVKESLENRGITCYSTKSPTDILRQMEYWDLFSNSLKEDRENIDPFGLSILAIGDRIIHQGRNIVPELEKGHWVLSDRYILNQILYQSPDIFAQLSRYIIKPDLGIIVDIDPEISTSRIKSRDEIEREDDRNAKETLRNRYLILGSMNGYKTLNSANLTLTQEKEKVMEWIEAF